MGRAPGYSPKQRMVLSWWRTPGVRERYDAVICDGAVRSGKTYCTALSFLLWALCRQPGQNVALCGKTILSLRRNLASPLFERLRGLGCSVQEVRSQNLARVELGSRQVQVYLFGGRDESSAALIQGMTLAGVLFDEVALMPRSFVEQALARCSAEGATFWFSCNPEHPEHWFYKEWIQKREQHRALYLHFTMEDNPSLSPECRDCIREFGLYCWAEGDRERPRKDFDHAMDELRYFVLYQEGRERRGGFYAAGVRRRGGRL